MLAKLKKRGAIDEIPGGRYRLRGRKSDGNPGPHAAKGDPSGEFQGEERSHPPSTQPLPTPGAKPQLPAATRPPAAWSSTTTATASSSSTLPLRNSMVTSSFPRDAIEDAMHGDHVQVKIIQRTGGARAEGRIVRILGRAHPTVVGLFRYANRGQRCDSLRRPHAARNRNSARPGTHHRPREETRLQRCR